jgi:hypothetical protein
MEHKEMWINLVNVLVSVIEDDDDGKEYYMDILEAMKILEEK